MRVRALRDRKERRAQGLFVVEGHKVVSEAFESGAEIVQCYATAAEEERIPMSVRLEVVSENSMQRMSSMKTAPGVLAIVAYTPKDAPSPAELKALIEDGSGTPGVLALDGLRDPGNMGALMRSAEWFGFKGLLVSQDCVDPIHPKVVQAAMGSSFRVPVWEVELAPYLEAAVAEEIKVVGFDVDAKSMFAPFAVSSGIAIIGSESHGMSPAVKDACTDLCSIPGSGQAESLNAAIAGSIAMAEWRRKTLLES
jgi:TrmH family RNA methyltransferase